MSWHISGIVTLCLKQFRRETMRLNIKRIEFEMDQRGWSRADLQKALGLKTRQGVSYYWTASHKLNFKTVEKLSRVFGVPAKDLLEWNQSWNPSPHTSPSLSSGACFLNASGGGLCWTSLIHFPLDIFWELCLVYGRRMIWKDEMMTNELIQKEGSIRFRFGKVLSFRAPAGFCGAFFFGG